MYRFIYITILSMCFYFKAHTQNLVPNPSFENYSSCPNTGNLLYYASPWFQPQTYLGNVTNSCSTELMNSCAGSSSFSVGVPQNYYGNQVAKTGNGYAGFFASADTVNTREYLEVELIASLISGESYCVELYISLADNSDIAISNMGIYFSNDSILDSTYNALDYLVPQITSGNSPFLTDKTNWMKIFGTYIAQGGEKFITIGNFHAPQNTNIQIVSGGTFSGLSYYYIDDISVTACDTTLTSVDETENDYNFSLYPNPSTGNISIKYDLKQSNDVVFKLYDIRGKLLHETVLNKEITSFDFSDVLANGVYFYQVSINNKMVKSDKVVIIK